MNAHKVLSTTDPQQPVKQKKALSNSFLVIFNAEPIKPLYGGSGRKKYINVKAEKQMHRFSPIAISLFKASGLLQCVAS